MNLSQYDGPRVMFDVPSEVILFADFDVEQVTRDKAERELGEGAELVDVRRRVDRSAFVTTWAPLGNHIDHRAAFPTTDEARELKLQYNAEFRSRGLGYARADQ